jgi:tRNA dimethylallyltransferase
MLNPKSETRNPKQIRNSKSKIKNESIIIFIVGPTAVGKSAVAGKLARMIGAEIVSCDSMQVYRGMDIATSKPPAALRRRVRHHLIGFVSPLKEYSVAQFRKVALKSLAAISKKGKPVIFTGGTGLYISALLDGIFEGGDKVKAEIKVEAIRNRLYKLFKSRGSGYLHGRLRKVDPAAAARIHPNDARRLIRALEVFEATGKPISLWQKERKGLRGEFPLRIFCLNMRRDELYRRIEQRVEEMFASGLEREARAALKRPLSRTAGFAIGLREIKGYLDGEYGLEVAKELIKRNTRNYAKRQLTWFRKDKSIEWVEIAQDEKPQQVAKRLRLRLRED